VGGPIALVKDGDRIVIDAATRRIDWFVHEEAQKKRREEWLASDRGKLNVNRGVLLRYARDVAVSPLSVCAEKPCLTRVYSLRVSGPTVTENKSK